MKKIITTKTIAVTGILTALEIILQLIGNYVALGPVSLNLSLIPVAIGAIIYGPLVGGFLGLVSGVIVLFAPATMAVFMPVNAGGTILTCLTKTLIAGVIAGFIYKPFKNKHPFIGAVVASILVPIINTSIFIGYSFAFFYPILEKGAATAGFSNPTSYLILGMIGWNFIFELCTSAILSPAVLRIIKYVNEHNKTV